MNTILTSECINSKTPRAVSFKLLLSLYLLIPLCLVVQIMDSWFFSGQVLSQLPSSPSHFLLFQVLFGTPHILASMLLITTNKTYFSFYRKKIMWMTLAIIVFFALANELLSYYVLYILVASWTVYHVLKQQLGVGRALYHLPNWAFYILLWLSIGAGIGVYMGIFLKDTLSPMTAEWVKQFSAGMVVCLVCMTVLCQRYVNTTAGTLFLWANTSLIVVIFYFYCQEYYFFAILMPRLIHDVTAYIFYIVHDVNKHHQHPQNFLYQFSQKIKLNSFLVLPAVSFLLTYVLHLYGDQWVSTITQFFFGMEVRKAVSLGLIGYFSLMHYYMEAFTWKKGSPYREYIRFN